MNTIPSSLLESTLNTRYPGMYRIEGVKEVGISDRIIRSDRCDSLSPRDREFLLSRGIRTVIDLRRKEEVEAKPSAFMSDAAFNWYNFSIEEGGMPPASYDDVAPSYMVIAETPSMKDVFKTIAAAEGGVLYHCTVGKDRTGVVSAILLLLAGLDKENIAYDYFISRDLLRPALEAFLSDHPEIEPRIVWPDTTKMLRFLDLFTRKYSTPEHYLQMLGLEDEEIRAIKV